MLVLLGAILAGLVVAIGWGFAALALFGRLRGVLAPSLTLGETGILGLVLLGMVGTVLNVALPLSPIVTGSAALLGAGAFAAGIGTVWRRHRDSGGGAVLVPAALLTGLLFWTARHAYRSAAFHFDTGLYHLPVLRQVLEFPVILGSANLHMRFGYNSTWPVVGAMQSMGSAGLAGAFAVNAVLLVLVLWSLGWRARRFFGGAGVAAAFALLAAVLLPGPLLRVPELLGNPNTDLPVILLVLLAFQLCLAVLDSLARGPAADQEARALYLMLAVVAAMAVTVKLSALPILLLLLPPLLARRRGGPPGLGDLAAVAGLGLAIGLPWLLRGIASSGCLAYPHPASCLAVPWRVDLAVARSDMDWVRAWARQPEVPPDQVLGGWAWLPGWIDAFLRDPAGWGVMAIVALAALALVAWRVAPSPTPPPSGRQRAGIAGVFVVAGAGIVFWFTGAPLLRYGQVWLVIPPLLVLALLAPGLWDRAVATRAGRTVMGRAAALAGAARLLVGTALVAWVLLAVAPTPRQLRVTDFPRLPQVATQEVRRLGTITLHRPLAGEQCWDAPRICTPFPVDALEVGRDFGLVSIRPAATGR